MAINAESEITKIYEKASSGVGASTLLEVMEPLTERRFEALMRQFFNCEPKLEILLDFRAKIAELYRIRDELRQVRREGMQAGEALGRIMSAS